MLFYVNLSFWLGIDFQWANADHWSGWEIPGQGWHGGISMQNPVGRKASWFAATTVRLAVFETSGHKRRLDRSLEEEGKGEGERKLRWHTGVWWCNSGWFVKTRCVSALKTMGIMRAICWVWFRYLPLNLELSLEGWVRITWVKKVEISFEWREQHKQRHRGGTSWWEWESRPSNLVFYTTVLLC